MAESLSVFCKSYRTDLRRVQRLLQSIKKYNTQNIPVYLSVPACDIILFKENLKEFNGKLISDLDIIAENKKIMPENFLSMPGNISQQIVKAEFWRLGYSENYLCVDSDAVFIRPFTRDSYVSETNIPYTVIDQGHTILNDCLKKSRRYIISNFFNETKIIKNLLERHGIDYSFGPFPVAWNGAVWQSLDENFLSRKNWSILDAISQHPVESHWYGEALLRYQAIPVLPRQAIFFVYHYGWQRNAHRVNSINESDLALLYDGVIYQSAWEREMDWPVEGGNMASRLARRFRRAIGSS
jgi:hypothetical protein